MAEVEPSATGGIPTANWVFTNLFLPFAAFALIFMAVALTGAFALMLQSGAGTEEAGPALTPWLCALTATLACFGGCNTLVIWHRERERLRIRFGG